MKKLIAIFSILCLLAAGASAELDNFNSGYDYLASGTSGTIWDGILNEGALGTLDAGISNPGVLTMTLSGDNVGWDASHTNAPVLYVNGPVNFDVQVHIASFTADNYLNGGIMARLSDDDYMSFNFNTFASSSYLAWRSSANGYVSGGSLEVAYPYIRLTKEGALFTYYAKENSGDDWTELKTYYRNDLDGLELQVGLYYANYSTNNGEIQFDDFAMVYDCDVPGDTNGDCFVDIRDLAELAAAWLMCNNPEDARCASN